MVILRIGRAVKNIYRSRTDGYVYKVWVSMKRTYFAVVTYSSFEMMHEKVSFQQLNCKKM